MVGAVSAAIKCSAHFNAVTNDLAIAMIASGCQGMDRAFKAIEVMRDAVDYNFQRLVIFIPANFTFCAHLNLQIFNKSTRQMAYGNGDKYLFRSGLFALKS